ncbi:MAG: DUF3997 domain-containing protein [Planctomycetota bacterium]|nr:DUF3997 domain-containing protein [Planctomycetota bacterium]
MSPLCVLLAALLIAFNSGCDVPKYDLPSQGDREIQQLIISHGYYVQIFMQQAWIANVDKKIAGVPQDTGELAHDDKFLIVKQQLVEPDAYRLTGEYKYWIIEFGTHKRLGPLTEQEFLEARETLKVSPSLKLQNLKDFEPTKILYGVSE